MREVLYLEMVRLGHGDRTLLSEVSVAPVQARLYCYHAQSAKSCTVQTHLTTWQTYYSMHDFTVITSKVQKHMLNAREHYT